LFVSPFFKKRINNIKGGFATFDKKFYNAGWCFFVELLEQEFAVKLDKLENF
jgi:hypothetical protein